MNKVAVVSSSFSKHQILREEIQKHFDEVKFNETGSPLKKSELVEFLHGFEQTIIGTEKVDESVLSQLPSLNVISKYGVGLDNIDFNACERHGVRVLHTQGTNKTSVAELTLGYMLNLCRNIFFSGEQLKNGQWNKEGGFQLSGKTVGIIGVGNVGKELIRLLAPFGCKLLVNDIIDQTAYYSEVGAIEVSKEELFSQSDIISIHTPLNPETQNLVSTERLTLMKPTASLINSARGGIVDIEALKKALRNQQIRGAALDVFPEEPVTDQELLNLHNLIPTPHIGGNSNEAVLNMGRAAISHLLPKGGGPG